MQPFFEAFLAKVQVQQAQSANATKINILYKQSIALLVTTCHIIHGYTSFERKSYYMYTRLHFEYLLLDLLRCQISQHRFNCQHCSIPSVPFGTTTQRFC